MRPDDAIKACETAHRRLFESLRKLDDEAVHDPSLLSGWSRGHVITHLARNADSHAWLFEGAALGEVRHQYATLATREHDIEVGAGRSAQELRDDLSSSCEQLESAWTSLANDDWDREGILVAGSRTMREIVFRRLREVLVHHVDLNVSYMPSEWPTIYVQGELARRLPGLPGRADPVVLVQWLLGRGDAPELTPW